jgi:hypothetical protein
VPKVHASWLEQAAAYVAKAGDSVVP